MTGLQYGKPAVIFVHSRAAVLERFGRTVEVFSERTIADREKFPKQEKIPMAQCGFVRSV
jgi:hypothetical protein